MKTRFSNLSESTASGLQSLSGIGFGDARDSLQQTLFISHPITSQPTLKFTCSYGGQFLVCSWPPTSGAPQLSVFLPEIFPQCLRISCRLYHSRTAQPGSVWGLRTPGVSFHEWGTRLRTNASASLSLGGQSPSWVSSGTESCLLY